MADDIGVGDVVSAVRSERRLRTGWVVAGQRQVVLAIAVGRSNQPCGFCGQPFQGRALLALDLDPQGYGNWCPCGWRKIGGSRSDTVRRFAEDLNLTPSRSSPKAVPA